MKALRWLIAAISLAIVVGVVHWESRRLTSPGALHPSHADVAALQGAAGCTACHGAAGAGESAMAAACYGCHGAVHEQVLAVRGVHGLLDRRVADACDDCHREHSGGVLALVGDASFRTAGLAAVQDFEHEPVVPFGLAGRHDALECRACHEMADAAALRPGERRFLGLIQACASCHEDPHRGDLGDDCSSCHGQVHAFEQVAGFAHVAVFPLQGGHAGVACRACHEGSSTNLIDEVRRAGTAPQGCADCHESPHDQGFLGGVAAARGAGAGGTCTFCHEVAHETFLGPAAQMTRQLHAATGFPLDPPHDRQQCHECHDGYGRRQPLAQDGSLRTKFAALFPGRDPGDCRACHGDPHGGQFDAGTTHGRCLECHEAAHFRPSTFDVANHVHSRFPLTGAHEAVACDACHEMEGGIRRFVPTATACAECHRDPHGGGFEGPVRPGPGGDGCARCHVTSSFVDVRWTSAAHRQWSGYPLDGGHARVSCMGCHEREVHRDGFVLNAPPRDCASCHADPHAGQFRREGRIDCARCHIESEAFTRVRFDHQRDSRFPLDEHHRTLDCAACHRPFAIPGGKAVVRYRPLGTECQDCHGSMKPERRGS